jgi:hypothetical protein
VMCEKSPDYGIVALQPHRQPRRQTRILNIFS